MPSCCVVPFCSSRDAGHRFPRDPKLRKMWLDVIKRDNFEPTEFSRICKRHFTEEDFIMPMDSVRLKPVPKLRRGVVPSQFKWTKSKTTGNNFEERNDQAKDQLPPLLEGKLFFRAPLIHGKFDVINYTSWSNSIPSTPIHSSEDIYSSAPW